MLTKTYGEVATLLSEALRANQLGNTEEVEQLLIRAKLALVEEAEAQASRIE